ncbi:MAG: hypothetical protein JHC26_11765 [Thermofilum sp.]|uniref:hypothetical protein n=1 Tax=Thermofilum sp. TaxID=1961369 RepID=UPI00259019C7|nr:hypothetical protein [Thermofilum sp.]MCI4409760.1 hypothetical protein [Thermofilum sp.]
MPRLGAVSEVGLNRRICAEEGEILEEIGRRCREISDYRIIRYSNNFYIRDKDASFLMLSRGRVTSEKIRVEFLHNSGRLIFGVDVKKPLGERDILFTATLIDAIAKLVHEDHEETAKIPDTIFAELEKCWSIKRNKRYTRIIAVPIQSEEGFYLFHGEVRTSKFLLSFRPYSKYEMLFSISNRIEKRYVRKIELFIWSLSTV